MNIMAIVIMATVIWQMKLSPFTLHCTVFTQQHLYIEHNMQTDYRIDGWMDRCRLSRESKHDGW